QDITQAALFLTAAAILVAGSSIFAGRLQELLKDYFDPRRIASSLEPAALLSLTGAAFRRFLFLMAPMMVALAVVAASVVFLQVKPLFSPQVVQPKFDKLNPIQGFQNIFFKSKTYIELLKNLVKFTVVLALAWFTIQGALHDVVLSSILRVEDA